MPHRAVTVTSHYAGAVPGLSPDHDAYQAILDTYQRVTDDQYNAAMADMATTRTPSHPNAPAEPAIACACGGSGLVPAWVADPEITGYPHERTQIG